MFDVMWQLPKGELFSTFLILADCCFLFCVSCHSQNSCTKEEESKICSLLTRLILSEFCRRASVVSCICWMPVYKKNICGRLKKNCCLIDVWSWGVKWIHELDRDVYLLMITHQIRKRQHTDVRREYFGPTCHLGSTLQKPQQLKARNSWLKW